MHRTPPPQHEEKTPQAATARGKSQRHATGGSRDPCLLGTLAGGRSGHYAAFSERARHAQSFDSNAQESAYNVLARGSTVSPLRILYIVGTGTFAASDNASIWVLRRPLSAVFTAETVIMGRKITAFDNQNQPHSITSSHHIRNHDV